MAALATVADLEVRLGATLSGSDLARAIANLEDVSILVRAEGSKDWMDEDSVPDEARLVTIQAALRAYNNPTGLAGENIAGAYSYTFGPGAQNGVYLNADEIRLCRIAAGLNPDGKPKGFLGSVRTPSAYGPGAEVVPVTYLTDAALPWSDTIPWQQGELLMGDEVIR